MLKRLLPLLVVVVFLSEVSAQWTSPTIDASYDGPTVYPNSATSGATQWYMTWDDDNLYVAISNANEAEEVRIFLDVDPIMPVNGGTDADGNLTDIGLNGYSPAPNLPIRADILIYADNNERELFRRDGSGGWQSLGNGSDGICGGGTDDYTGNANGQYSSTNLGNGNNGDDRREFRISWLRLLGSINGGNRPSSFNWLGYVSYGNGMYAQLPLENYNGNNVSANPNGLTRYFTVSETGDGTSTNPFSRNSYAHPFGVTNNSFGLIDVWDFTMNSGGQQIARLSSGGNWDIQNDLVVNDGTIFFGSGGSNYGLTTVEGNILISGSGSLNMDQTNKVLNVLGDIQISSSNASAFALSGTLGGDVQIGGDFVKTSGGFSCNNRQILFDGDGNQLFESNETEEINFLENVNLDGVLTVASDANIPNSTNSWVFGFGSSTIIQSGVTLTFSDQTDFFSNSGGIVNVFGTIISNGQVGANFGTNETALIFENGSQYIHSPTRSGQSTLGEIPVATWNLGSTCLINGFTNPVGSFGFIGDTDEQLFDVFEWNCSAQNADVSLAGNTITANTFIMTSTGTGSIRLGGGTNGSINCIDFVQTAGTIDFASGSGDGSILCSGIYLHTGGTLTETGSGTGLVEFDGSSSQTVTSTGTVNDRVNYRLNNSAGINIQAGSTIEINADAFFYRTQGAVSGSGVISYQADGGLSYDGASALTTADGEFPITNGPSVLEINNAAGVTLHATRTLSEEISLIDGLLTLDANDLILASDAVVSGTPSTSSYVNTNGSGELIRSFGGFVSGIEEYPIGNGGYAPVSFDFSNGILAREIGFKAVDGNHPNLTPPAQTNFLSRYWTVSNSAAGTYDYDITLGYESSDVSGTESLIKINRWDGTDWNHFGSSANTSTDELSTTVTLDEVSAPISGTYELTGRVKPREINEDADFDEFTTIEPTPSPEQTFNLNATALTSDITITAPSGFSVSLTSGGTFTSSITITPTGGNVPNTPIFVRLDGTTEGAYTGNLTIASTGVTTISIPLIGTVLSPNTIIIDFDNGGNWTPQTSTSITSYQLSHEYNESDWEFTGGEALRRSISEPQNDGVDLALDQFSWNLRNNPSVVWTATYNLDGTANSFGFKVRRWDDSPSPDFIVEYSIDGGTSYSTALSAIDNTYLGNTSKWKTFNFNFSTATSVGVGELIVRVSALGTTERIMIDDFSFDVTPNSCAQPNLFFRSKNSGNWTNRGTWETSTTGGVPWSDAQCAPYSDSSQEIIIRNGHTVSVGSDIDFELLSIQSGGRLLHQDGTITINASPATAELIIENGGVYEFDGGSTPGFTASTLMRVETGGIVRVTQNQGGLSGDMAGSNSSPEVIYQDGAIFEWNNNNAFATSNQTYFPDAGTGIKPIFRISASAGIVGGGNPTVINGIFEANANVTWQNSGTKTFRNGITGTGDVTQSASPASGVFRITEDAELGGTGTLLLNNNNLEITSGAIVDLISDKTINSTGSSTPDITINGTLNDNGFSIPGDYNSVSMGSAAVANVENEFGFNATGGTFGNTSATFSLDDASLVDYQRSGAQEISGIDYGDVLVRGSGVKSFEGSAEARELTVLESASIGSQVGASISIERDFTVQSPATFDQSAYDELSLTMLGAVDASVNSWTNVRCLNFNTNTSNDITLFGGFSQLEIKDTWDCDMTSGSGFFSDNGLEIVVGGDAILRGAATNYNLSGTLRFIGEQTNQSVQGNTPTAQVFAEINNLIVNGGPNPPSVNIPTTAAIVVLNDVDILEGSLSMAQGVFNLGGNWTNYNQSGFDEGVARINFNGIADQTIACPGGEVFSSINVDKPSSNLILVDNLSVSGVNSNILDMFSGSTIDLNGNELALTGTNGNTSNTSLRVNNGVCSIESSIAGAIFRIQGGTKTVISLSGGSLDLGANLTTRLESGMECGAPDVTTVEHVFEIASGGFIQTNPPLYLSSSILRYVTPSFTKGNEWNALAGQGYPNDVEVDGSNVLMNVGSPHAAAGNLTILNEGTLSMGEFFGASGTLTVEGNVTFGQTGLGTLNLGDNIGGDLFVGGSFVQGASGTLNTNDREVVMTGTSVAAGPKVISGPIDFAFLAIDYSTGTIEVVNDITIENRLRLSDGQFDFTTNASNYTMLDNSRILRESAASTVDKEPIVNGSDQYDIEYTGTMTTALEFSSTAVVDELLLNGTPNGALTVTLGDDHTFNGDLRLTDATLDLGGNVLTAAENVPGSGAFDAQIIVDATDTCRVTGPAGSVFQVNGTGGLAAGFRTKQVLSLNNTKLLFEENVLVRLGNGGFDFGTGNPTKIDGILEITAGGYAINNSCFYGNQSLLRFENGFSYSVDALDVTWDDGDIASGNPGIPFNVESSGNASTNLTLNSPRSLRNDLTITGSQFTLTTNSGTFEIGGDWNRSGATSAFNPTGQEVIFNGTESQTINTFNGVPSEVFFKLTFANTGIKTLQEDVTVLDELKIESNGNLDLGDQTIFLEGDWNNLASEAAITENGTVQFQGSEIQNIFCSGGEVFDNLAIDNSSELNEGIVLNNDIRIEGDLTLASGIIHPAAVEETVLGLNATNSGGDFRSYVNGVIRKDGFVSTAAFTFPVGYFNLNSPGDTTSVWQPAAILPQSTSVALNFDVRYFHENAVPGTNYPSNPPNVEPILETASTCNYWDINRSGAPVDAQLRLFWNDSTTCFDISNPSLLSVARYSGSIWEDQGYTSNSSSSPFNQGYVQSDWISAFSPFAIATSTANNILPITLLSFHAEVKDGLVHTSWVTASELNNDFFTVERSKDGSTWEKVGTINGAGDSNTELTYAFVDDDPYSGISYYRLRQTDFDGTTTLSEPRAVEILQGSDFGLDKVYRGQDGLNLVYRATAPYVVVEIYDLLGKRIHGELVENYGNGFATIHPDLARGAYVLRLSHGSDMDAEKFVW